MCGAAWSLESRSSLAQSSVRSLFARTDSFAPFDAPSSPLCVFSEFVDSTIEARLRPELSFDRGYYSILRPDDRPRLVHGARPFRRQRFDWRVGDSAADSACQSEVHSSNDSKAALIEGECFDDERFDSRSPSRRASPRFELKRSDSYCMIDPQIGVVSSWPDTAICVRIVDVLCVCNSHLFSGLAPFFIDPRA
jgi:hypothetical protein